MTAPSVAAGRFASAWLLGMGLGLVYSFLRPLRPRHTALADGVFSLVLLWCWLFHSFALCRGDMRLGYLAGFLLGGMGSEAALGRLLQPLFRQIWQGIGKVLGFFALPLKIFSHFGKKSFASAKKWVTIKWNNRRHQRRIPGGEPYGRKGKSFQPDQNRISSQQSFDQDRGHRGYLVVYDGADHPAPGAE